MTDLYPTSPLLPGERFFKVYYQEMIQQTSTTIIQKHSWWKIHKPIIQDSNLGLGWSVNLCGKCLQIFSSYFTSPCICIFFSVPTSLTWHAPLFAYITDLSFLYDSGHISRACVYWYTESRYSERKQTVGLLFCIMHLSSIYQKLIHSCYYTCWSPARK